MLKSLIESFSEWMIGFGWKLARYANDANNKTGKNWAHVYWVIEPLARYEIRWGQPTGYTIETQPPES